MIKGIAHVAYKVRDMEAALHFYVDGLGFKRAFSLPRATGEAWIEYIQVAPGQYIELFYPESEVGGKDSHYMHLCLDIEDVPAFAKRIAARGITVSEPKTGRDGNTQAWISDPDGNSIELMQVAPDSPQATFGK